MATSTATGNLVIIDANTDTPSVYWKGVKVEDVRDVKVGAAGVVITVEKTDVDIMHDDLAENGVKIKKVVA